MKGLSEITLMEKEILVQLQIFPVLKFPLALSISLEIKFEYMVCGN